MLKRLLLAVSKLLARLSLWLPSAWALYLVRPMWTLDQESQDRLFFVSTFVRDDPRVRTAFAGLLLRELDHSAAHNVWLASIAWRMGQIRLAQLIFQRTCRLFPGSAETAVARREEPFTRAIVDGSLQRDLAHALSAIGVEAGAYDTVCVVFLSARYVDMFRLWLVQFRRFGFGHLVVCVLDPEAGRAARADVGDQVIDLSAHFQPDAAGKLDYYGNRHIWMLRVFLLELMLTRGINILSFDLDALLVGDLEVMFRLFPPSDVVVQRDYSVPLDVARKFGFILCCGFLAVKSNSATLGLFRQYSQRVAIELDDQQAINHLLKEAGVAGRQSHPTYMSFTSLGVSWVCPDPSLVSRDIAQGTVIRHFQRVGQTIEELKNIIEPAPQPHPPNEFQV